MRDETGAYMTGTHTAIQVFRRILIDGGIYFQEPSHLIGKNPIVSRLKI